MTNNWKVEEGPIDGEAKEVDLITIYPPERFFPEIMYQYYLKDFTDPRRPLSVYYQFKRDNPGVNTIRFWRVYKFLILKGYYDVMYPPLLVTYRQKITLDDLIWFGEKIDLRIVPLIPALLIRFPGHFRKIRKIPPTLAEAVRSLRAGQPDGKPYRGFPYILLKNWLDFIPKDQRSTIRQGHRLSVRLEPEVTQALNQFVERTGMTTTEAIRRAIVNLTQAP